MNGAGIAAARTGLASAMARNLRESHQYRDVLWQLVRQFLTLRYRRTLLESRLQPTGALADALLALRSDAPALLSASAVGYYGDQPGVHLDETAAPGETFLADVCVQWEREAQRAATTGGATE